MGLNIPTDLLWLVLLVLPVFFILLMQTRNHGYGKGLPPSPTTLPIIGNLHKLGPLVHQSLAKLSQTYGPVMLVHLGQAPVFVVSSAEAAKEVLQTHDAKFCNKPPVISVAKFSYNYTDITFTHDGKKWRDMKKMISVELFNQKQVKSFLPIRVREVETMIDSISVSAFKSEVVDISEELTRLAANISFQVAFGTSFRGSAMDHHGFKEFTHELVTLLRHSAADYFPFAGCIADWLSGKHQRIDSAFKNLDQFYQQVINEHTDPVRTKSASVDFIDIMLQAEKESISSRTNNFTKNNIKGILFDAFTGGVGTLANVLIWVMTELASNPNVMQKAQAEIRACAGKHGRVSESDIENLNYLKMVLKETMRLHPIVPILSRETRAHCQIHEFKVEPNTAVYVNIWAIGRDSKIWNQPEKFTPERFMDSRIDYKGTHIELIPFGAGRRICPGINLGMGTVELALANLLYWFNWRLPDGMKPEDMSFEEGVGITAFKKTPLKLVPTKYEHEDCP